MRILLVLSVLMLTAILAAMFLVPDLRKPKHEYYVIECQTQGPNIIRHIVKYNDSKIDQFGTRGKSVKGYVFKYSRDTVCTRHPITENQVQEYFKLSK